MHLKKPAECKKCLNISSIHKQLHLQQLKTKRTDAFLKANSDRRLTPAGMLDSTQSSNKTRLAASHSYRPAISFILYLPEVYKPIDLIVCVESFSTTFDGCILHANTLISTLIHLERQPRHRTNIAASLSIARQG